MLPITPDLHLQYLFSWCSCAWSFPWKITTTNGIRIKTQYCWSDIICLNQWVDIYQFSKLKYLKWDYKTIQRFFVCTFARCLKLLSISFWGTSGFCRFCLSAWNSSWFLFDVCQYGKSSAKIQRESESLITKANTETAPKCTQWWYYQGRWRVTSNSIKWQVRRWTINEDNEDQALNPFPVEIPMHSWSFPGKNKKKKIPTLLLKWVEESFKAWTLKADNSKARSKNDSKKAETVRKISRMLSCDDWTK